MKHTSKHATMITAHSGAEQTPPCSLQYLELALGTGCDALEVDVRRGEDGLLYIAHDHWAAGEAPLSLRACFARVAADQSIKINCDMKTPGLAADILRAASEAGLEDRVLFTGSASPQDEAALAGHRDVFWRNLEELPRGTAVQAAISLSVGTINMNFRAATPEFLISLTENGLCTSVWTVDDDEEMQRLLRLGVKNITTNRPLRALALREAHEAGLQNRDPADGV